MGGMDSALQTDVSGHHSKTSSTGYSVQCMFARIGCSMSGAKSFKLNEKGKGASSVLIVRRARMSQQRSLGDMSAASSL